MKIADLFCGAGGTSTGILKACAGLGHSADLLAVNHWPTAVNTHTLNHPGVRHLCETLENISPAKVISGGRLNLLAASPECTHHSNAAGGRPRNDQSRATAWHVCRWASDLRIDNIMIENVREFQNWGPLSAKGKPLKSRKGETFRAFIQALRSLGYNVDHRVLNAADFGDPTSRRRLIIMARRSKPVIWPEPSHGTPAQPWRTAREIIDWDIKGKSIFARKKPLSANTIRRIAAGLKKFGGANADPFLVMLYGTNNARSVDFPTPTVTAGGGHIALAEPFLVMLYGQSNAADVNSPLPTVTAGPGHIALAEPFLVTMEHGGGERGIDRPLPVITTARGGAIGVCEPFMVKFHGNHSGREDGAQRVHETSKPLPTLDTSNRFGLVEPFIVKYYGTANANSINEPLDTVTTKDRFLLVEPKTGRAVAEMDIRFRMLHPHELAAAMSFPAEYQFTGNRTEQVKHIGNAVPVELACACATALLNN